MSVNMSVARGGNHTSMVAPARWFILTLTVYMCAPIIDSFVHNEYFITNPNPCV
jgi:hypothetical protein